MQVGRARLHLYADEFGVTNSSASGIVAVGLPAVQPVHVRASLANAWKKFQPRVH